MKIFTDKNRGLTVVLSFMAVSSLLFTNMSASGYRSQLSSAIYGHDMNRSAPIKANSTVIRLPEDLIDKKYEIPLVLNKSNMTVDCRGALIDGENFKGSGKTAIVITNSLDSKGNVKNISNVSVVNCHFKNFKTAIAIQNASASSIYPSSIATNIKIGDLSRLDGYRANSPKGISLENLYIEDSTDMGIAVNRFVKGVTIRNVTIKNSVIGIHLSPGSKNTSIESSRFENIGKRDSATNREAIVIDGSIYNSIQNNLFVNNSDTDIALYKNCGEVSDGIEGRLREEGANNNTIAKNIFIKEISDLNFKEDKNGKITNQAIPSISIADRAERGAAQWLCSEGYYYIKNNDLEKIDVSNRSQRLYRLDVQDDAKKNYWLLESPFNDKSKVYGIYPSFASASADLNAKGKAVLKNRSSRDQAVKDGVLMTIQPTAFYNDIAQQNVVTENIFYGYYLPVAIADSNSTVQNNKFYKTDFPLKQSRIDILSRARASVGQMLIGNKVANNCHGDNENKVQIIVLKANVDQKIISTYSDVCQNAVGRD